MESQFSSATLECDIVMKGGITSGVIYPRAITEFAKTYRLRGLGGASAGAIGAALAAAAEFGRDRGGFEKLDLIPDQLGGGKLGALFQPQRSTRKLFPVLLAATGHAAPGQPTSVIPALLRSYPLAAAVGVLPGLALLVVGVVSGGLSGWLLAACGLLLAALGAGVGVATRVARGMTRDVPENLFGICRGIAADGDGPGFTDWLSDRIDDLAGVDHPLTFGDLWGDGVRAEDPTARRIDLRMISTCLSQSRPYELPWQARTFFFDPTLWRTLFPSAVIDAMEAAPPAMPDDHSAAELAQWRWQEQVAARHEPPLRRMPEAADLPVIVATRMSLSFPLLIAAIPLWNIDYRSARTSNALRSYRAGALDEATSTGLDFSQLWFTDGGLCSNFPVHMFDAPLAVRPSFAINLGDFAPGRPVSADQRENVEFASTNSQGLLPPYHPIPTRGLGALLGFASASFSTARDWRDNSYLDVAGYRDRIVRVLQSDDEGGLNLFMDSTTITGLADRGRVAAEVMVDQFTGEHYTGNRTTTRTGWDNHRWVRFRAIMAVLPDFLAAWREGRSILAIDETHPPSYPLTVAGRRLTADISSGLDWAADASAKANTATRAGVTRAPRPKGALRRVSEL